jgi:hypothetical protein
MGESGPTASSGVLVENYEIVNKDGKYIAVLDKRSVLAIPGKTFSLRWSQGGELSGFLYCPMATKVVIPK